MKALIVDDEILVRKGISMGIDWNEMGFSVVKEANNGVEALDIAKDSKPDLILTDIRMPKMDGLELIKQLKVYCPDSVIIVLTCLNDSQYVREAMQFGGALDYVLKLSLSTEELEKTIKKATTYITKNSSISKKDINLKYYINLSIEEETTLKDSIESGNLDLAINCIKQIFQKIYNQKLQINTQIEWYEIVGFYSSILKKYGGNIYTIEIENKKLTQWVDESDDISQLESRLIEMTKLFFSYLKKLKNKQYGPEITLAIDYMNKHYNEIIKLSDAASVVGLNTSYFSKKFKKVTGINFIDYLNNIRIEKAKEILQNTNKSIYVIAQEIGYSNDSYFCRIFKQSVGMSPQQYKKNSVKDTSSTMR